MYQIAMSSLLYYIIILLYNYYTTIIILDVRLGKPLYLVLFLQDCLWYFAHLFIHMNLKSSLSSSMKNFVGILINLRTDVLNKVNSSSDSISVDRLYSSVYLSLIQHLNKANFFPMDFTNLWLNLFLGTLYLLLVS